MHRRATSTPPTRVASSPFDGSTGDVTLRSSDGVDFHCFSQILVAASPIFADMVAVGNANPDPSSSGSTTNRPIVSVTEDSKTLDSLLRFIYPIQKPSQSRSLEDIAPLLEASLKYMMDYPASSLKEELLAFAQNRPMQVWATGCRLMLEDIARAGAERMLHYRELGSYTHLHQFVPIEEFVRTADSRGVSAADYRRLWIYHHRRGEVEQDFSFTLPLPRQTQDQPARGDPNIPWDFFSSVLFPDTTCHAADGKTFLVHNALLCMNSPVLKEKIMKDIRLTQTQGINQSQHHLRFTEESPVLAHLLRLCYPGDAPLPEDHHLFLAVLKAADKFDMSRIVDLLSAKWDSIAAARPASVYFAALHYGFPELARVAARQVPRTSPAMLLYVPEMEHAPAIHWERLSDYWAAASVAVDRAQTSAEKLWQAEPGVTLSSTPEALDQFLKEWSEKRPPPHDRGLPCLASCEKRGPSWVLERRDDVLAELRRRPSAQDMPTVEELMRRSVAPTLSEKPWCPCCFNVAQDIVRLGTVFRQGMLSELDEVPLIT